MSKTITIASIQMFVHKKKKQNVEQVKNHLKYINKVFPQVEMVVFPELSVSEPHLEPKEQAEKIRQVREEIKLGRKIESFRKRELQEIKNLEK